MFDSQSWLPKAVPRALRLIGFVPLFLTLMLLTPQQAQSQGPPPLPGCMNCTSCFFPNTGRMCKFGFVGQENCSQVEWGGHCECLPYGGNCSSGLMANSREADAAMNAIRTLTAGGDLPADGQFFFASRSDGDVVLRRKCDGMRVALLSQGDAGFVLLGTIPALATPPEAPGDPTRLVGAW